MWVYGYINDVAITYDNLGRPTEEKMMNVLSGSATVGKREYSYHGIGKLATELQCWKYTLDDCNETHADADVYEATINWRPDGRVGSVCVDADANGATCTSPVGGQDDDYAYDTAGQLLGYGDGCATSGGAPNSSCQETWAYDLQGNRTGHDPDTATSGDSIGYGYNTAGQMTTTTIGSNTTTHSYDAAGRRTTTELPGSPSGTCNGTDPCITYDARGLPVAFSEGSTTTHQLTYDGERNLVGIADANADLDVVWDTTLAVPQIIVMGTVRLGYDSRRVDASNGTWYGHDWTDTTNQTVHVYGNSDIITYDPYGTPNNPPASFLDYAFGYRGELHIGDRAIHLRNRQYDPTTGTFLSPDAVDGEDGTPDVANPYDYVDNDPLNGIDPLGLCRMKDGDYVFDHLANICDNARAHATSSAGCGGADWGGTFFYEWDPFTTIDWRGGHGCSVTLRDGTMYGAWWDVSEHLCLHRPGSNDGCRSVKAAHPGFYQGLVVVAVLAGGYWAVMTVGPEAAAACAARSDLCWALVNGSSTTGPSSGPATVSSGGVTVNVERLELTHTVANNASSRPFVNSPLTMRAIVGAASPVPDPQGAANTFRWDVPGIYGGSAGTWELVINVATNLVYHFNFVRN